VIFGMIRRLVGMVVILVVAALVGLDFGAKWLAARQVADQARHASGASSGSASISGFPFLYDTIAQGRVQGLHVHLGDVPAGPGLRLQSVTVDLSEVHFDRHRLWAHRKVTVTSVSRATGVIDVSVAELSAVAGKTVTIGPPGPSGQPQVLVDLPGGRTVAATATITSGHFLQVVAGGLPVIDVDLARTPLVQECAMSLRVTGSGVEASCTMSPVPPSLIAAVSSS
jgi:DUF2993 family protein